MAGRCGAHRWAAAGWLLALIGGIVANAAPGRVEAASTTAAWAPRTQRFTVADGLPDQTIYSAAQDADGFLWFGSERGLIRYDGRRFHALRHDPSNPRSIGSDSPSTVFVDRQGQMWLGTWGGGLDRFDSRHLTAEHWQFAADDPDSLASNYVQTIFEDSRGRLWIGTGAGLMQFDRGRGHPRRAFTGAEGAAALNDHRIWAIAEAADGRLWLATHGGLVRYAPATGEVERFLRDDQGRSREGLVRAVFVDPLGRPWIATGGRLGRVDIERDQLHEVHLPEATLGARLIVSAVLPAGGGQFWLGTWSGVWMLDSRSEALVPIGQSGQHQWFPADDVRGMHVDRSGVLWVATRYNGVARIELGAPQFRLYRDELARLGDGMGSELVRSVFRSDNHVWLTTEGALVRVDLDQGVFAPQRGSRGLRAGRGGPSAVDDEGAEAAAYLASFAGPIRLDLRSQRTTLLRELLDASRLVDDNLPFVVGDSRGQLWWGTQREGLLLSDRRGKLIRHFAAPQGRSGDLADGSPICVVEDRRQRVWICSSEGLSLLRPGSDAFEVFRASGAGGGGLSHKHVSTVMEDRAGRIWAGTRHGLNVFDEDRQEFVAVPNPDATSLTIDAVVEAEAGQLWIAHGGKLQRFDADARQWRGEPLDPGERDLAFFPRAGLALDARRLLFGSNRGLLLFDPSSSPKRAYVPPVAITRAWIDRKELGLNRLGVRPSALQLEPSAKVLEIEFSALDFRPSGRTMYRYRLQGFDPDWVDAGGQAAATYTNLAPGNYRFQVMTAGAEQRWSKSGMEWAIEALPPWWLDRRLQIMVAASCALLLFAAIRWYHARLRRRQVELERLVAERSATIVRQQAQLMMQDKLASLGTLTAGVAHEINNPANFAYVSAQNLEVDLAAFDSELQKLAGEDADPAVLDFFRRRFAGLREHTATMREGAERIRAIVAHLRSFTRLDEAERKPVLVDDGLLSTLSLVRTQYGDDIEIDLALASQREVDGWPAQLNQVFMNLIVNACQAIRSNRGRRGGGRLRIATRDVADGVQIEIGDNGVGIAAEHVERIFEPFFTTKPVGEGSGLGLSISYGIVQRHGGRLEVDSQPGEGTRVRLFLPWSAPAPVDGNAV